jgi:hypothetical protein
VSRSSFLLLALVAFTGVAGLAPAQAARPDCPISGHGKLPPPQADQEIAIYASNETPLVMVEIADHAVAPFVLDFGSGGNLVSLDLAARLGLPKLGPSSSVDGIGEPVPGYHTCLRNVRVGSVAIPDGEATAFPYSFHDAEGIVGPASFNGRLVRFDGPGSRMKVLASRMPAADWGKPVRWRGSIGDTVPMVAFSIGDVQIDAILDTGSTSRMILPLVYRERFKFLSAPVKVGDLGFAANATVTPVFEGRVAGTLSAGSLKVENPLISFADIEAPLIGWPLIRQMTFVIDPANQLTWFPPEAR